MHQQHLYCLINTWVLPVKTWLLIACDTAFYAIKWFNPINSIESLICSMANSEDPDEMLHNAAFHQGLNCLYDKNNLQKKKYIVLLEIITCNPSVYTMDHSKFIAPSQKEGPIRA